MQAARARPAASGCEVLEGLGAPARGDVSRGYDCSVNGRMARWLAEAGPASQSCTRGRGGGGRTATAAALVLSVLYAGLSGYADAQLEPAGRLQGKIAVAEFSPGITPGQISGTIEFRQCQQGAGIDGVSPPLTPNNPSQSSRRAPRLARGFPWAASGQRGIGATDRAGDTAQRKSRQSGGQDLPHLLVPHLHFCRWLL